MDCRTVAPYSHHGGGGGSSNAASSDARSLGNTERSSSAPNVAHLLAQSVPFNSELEVSHTRCSTTTTTSSNAEFPLTLRTRASELYSSVLTPCNTAIR